MTSGELRGGAIAHGPEMIAYLHHGPYNAAVMEVSGMFALDGHRQVAAEPPDQAEQRYLAVAAEARRRLAEMRVYSSLPTLLVAGLVEHLPEGAWSHVCLARMAEEGGTDVAAQLRPRPEGPGPEFVHYGPPTAAGIEDYWRRRSEEISFSVETPAPSASDEEVWNVLMRISRGYQSSRIALAAQASPDRLHTWLDGSSQMATNALGMLQRWALLADGSNVCLQARNILAKLGDQDLLQQLRQEMGERGAMYWEDALTQPLGLFMRNDSSLLVEAMRTVEQKLANDPAYTDVAQWVSALAYSGDPLVGALLAQILDVPPTAGRAYGDSVLSWALVSLPKYVDAVQGQPETTHTKRALQTVERAVTGFLRKVHDGTHPIHPDSTLLQEPLEQVLIDLADTIRKFNNPDNRRLLRQNVVALFAATGSVLEGPYGNGRFVRQYLAYRQQYGHIPEIDRRIRLRVETSEFEDYED